LSQEGGIRSAAVRDAVAARDAQASENEEELASDAAPSTGSPRLTDRAAPHVSAAAGARQLASIFADEEEAERGDGGECVRERERGRKTNTLVGRVASRQLTASEGTATCCAPSRPRVCATGMLTSTDGSRRCGIGDLR
jgi:hypothetical protein